MQTYQEELQENAITLQGLMAQDKAWEALSGKTIMISGATGMIGKCMIDLLMQYNDSRKADVERPVSVIALSRDEERARQRLGEHWQKDTFRYFSCDVTQGIPECGHADYIIHAASNTHPLQYANDAVGTITANVIGLKELLDYAVSHQASRFCFVSSVEIYGENRGDVDRFREDYLGELNCNTLRAGYPESKRVGEALCNAYAKAHQLDFVIPRLSRVYGPTMLASDSKAIAQFIGKAAAREDIVLKSAGGQLYSYTYVMDAVMGILTVLCKGGCGEAYNISDTASEVTLRGICEWLAQDNQVEIVFDMPEASEAAGYSTATKALLDTEKIEALGWEPRTHMREGLCKTVRSCRQKEGGQ